MYQKSKKDLCGFTEQMKQLLSPIRREEDARVGWFKTKIPREGY